MPYNAASKAETRFPSWPPSHETDMARQVPTLLRPRKENAMNIYTAEDSGGDVFMVAAWEGLSRESFKEFVLENLARNNIPERNIQQLDLCEWDEATFFAWHTPLAPAPAGTLVQVPNPTMTWREACYGHLYWTYPGVWSEKQVTRMPPELAAEFWDGEGVDRSDPKHPDFHDTMAGVWDK